MEMEEDREMHAEQEETGLSVEEAFARIEERISVLERPDATLEEAFLAYQEGMELVRRCDASIDRIEKRVREIAADGTERDFQE